MVNTIKEENFIINKKYITKYIELHEIPKYIIVFVKCCDNSKIKIKNCTVQFCSEEKTYKNKDYDDIKISLFDNKISYKNDRIKNKQFIFISPKDDFYLLKFINKYFLQLDFTFSNKYNNKKIEIHTIIF